MAQQSEAGIPRAGKRKWGYDPAQVDEFLEKAHKLYDSDDTQLTQRDIQNVSFDLKKGGYVIAQVDAALSRLERAVVDKRTQWEIAHEGRVTWKARTKELYREIVEHADRTERERFAPGHGGVPSYDRRQVDRLIDRIVDKCAVELGVDGAVDDPKLDKVTSDFVSNAVFTQRKGRKGYDERQVDYFLNSCVELLSRIESFDRVADYIGADGDADGSATSLGSQPRAAFPSQDPSAAAPSVAPVASGSVASGSVAPLFSSDDVPQSFAPAASAVSPTAAPSSEGNDSFDALSQAEQNLFASAPAPSFTPAPAVAPVEPVAVPPVVPIASTPIASTPTPAPVASLTPAPSPSPIPVSFPPIPSTPVQTTVTPAPAQPVSVQPEPAQSEPPAPTAPVTAPATPVTAPAAEETTPSAGKHVISSLAALAQMAEVSQEFPEVSGVTPFEPHMPSLDVPSGFGPDPIVPTPRPAATSQAAPTPAPAQVTPVTPAPVTPAAPVTSTASAPVNVAPSPVAPTPTVTSTPATQPAVQPRTTSSASASAVSDAHAIPSFAPAVKPARQSAPAVKPAPASEPPRPSFSLLSTDNSDLDIPDLSFPSIEGFDGKKDNQ